jgi:hypothetical protein
MIVLIYVLSILYILGYFIHKLLKILLSYATQINHNIKERIIYMTLLNILDLIFQNTYFLLIAVCIFLTISIVLVFIYIYYRFLLVPVSKIILIGCKLFNTFSFFPITELKRIGVFYFLDKLIFSDKIVSDIVINIILESTVKSAVSDAMYKEIKDSIIKDSSFSLEDICGDTKKKLKENEESISKPQHELSHEDMIKLKREALIKQCTNTQMQNYLSNEDTNFTTGIKNKFFKNVCTATYSGFT